MSKYDDAQISLEPAPVRAGDEVNIKYRGLLKNCGASEVYLYYGADGWRNPGFMRMERLENGEFSAKVKADAAHALDFCFKDAANNWDNNSSWNWKVDVI